MKPTGPTPCWGAPLGPPPCRPIEMGDLCIGRFTNFTAAGKLPRIGKRFRSTKGEGHGFGLVRIDSIVERLNGYLKRASEDGAFTTEILIPQTADPARPGPAAWARETADATVHPRI